MRIPVELFLALRYLRPRRTFVSAITVLSVMGVTLGVWALIVVLSVMAGFEKELQEKVLGFHPHLTISNGGILDDADAIMAKVAKDPAVQAQAPYATGPVLVEFAGRITTPIFRGISPQAEDAVIPFQQYITGGEYELRGESVLVGQEWARKNGAFVGDKILVYAPRHFDAVQRSRDPKAPVMLPSEMLITGIFSTGMYDYDLNFIITSLGNMQELYKLGAGVHAIAVRAKSSKPADLVALQKRLNKDFTLPLQSRTWMDQNRSLFSAIATERVVMTFILFFIMIVAAFGLCSTLITITVQKSREIGVLKALGAKDRQVLSIFVLHGLIVGVIGAVGGVVLAILALAYRNAFRTLMGKIFGVELFSPDIYSFAEIPAESDPRLMVLIALAAVGVCVLAAFIPARAAARIDPARALRYE